MIGIVVVAHGGLARELLAALEHVMGGRQPGCVAIGIDPDDRCASKQNEIDAAVSKVETGDGVVVVTDMFGGTPSNLSVEACRDPGRVVVYGANLPLLVKLTQARRLPLHDAVAISLTAGRKYINSVEGSGPDRLPIAL